jgi:hypothetical protein
MTPTRTLIAVLVWLRASDRISVIVLVIALRRALVFTVVWRSRVIGACFIGAIHGEVVRPDRRAERDGREVRRLAEAAGAPNETDDLGTHDKPSRIAMAMRPASASDIKYPVMRCSLLDQNARQIAVGAIVSGANPILSRGPLADAGVRRRAGTFARAGQCDDVCC